MQHALFTGLDWIEAALGLLVLTNLSLLAVERQRLAIRLLGLQGILLGILPVLSQSGPANWRLYAAVVVFLAVKGLVMPWLLMRTCRQLPVQKLREPYFGNAFTVALGLGGLALALWLKQQLEVPANPLLNVFFPVAFAAVLTGILLIVTRRRALDQVFGYLVTENGIYLLSIPMIHASALWIELTILLDVLVGIFVMGVAILHINRAFDSIDVDQFASLKD